MILHPHAFSCKIKGRTHAREAWVCHYEGFIAGQKKNILFLVVSRGKKNRSLEKPLDSLTLYAFLYGLFLNYSKQGLQLMPIMKKSNPLYSKRK